MMKAWFLGFGVLFSIAHAHGAPLNRYTLKDEHDDGIVLKFIVEDPSLRDDQHEISQWKVGEQFVPISESAKVDELAQAWWNTHPSEVMRIQLRQAARFGNLPLPPTPTPAPLWTPVKDQWSAEDEDDYSEWIKTQTGENFDRDSGLLADCADVGLLFRWVYAREKKLPIANTMGGSGKLFGHFSSSRLWDRLSTHEDWKKDERFKAAMRYLFDQTYTGSLMSDLYPVEISPKYVRPGTVYMIIRSSSGHTQTVYQVDREGITTEWGNEPAAEDIYVTRVIIEYENTRGFVMWRNPRKVTEGGQNKWVLIPAKEMPGYSREQFAQKFKSGFEYRDWVYQKLGLAIGFINELENLVESFRTHLELRMKLTVNSITTCFLKKCDPSSAEYENGSTPGRDRSLREVQADFLKIIQNPNLSENDIENAMQTLDEAGEVLVGTGLTYRELLNSPERLKSMNSDPRVSFAERWGFRASTGDVSLDFVILSNALYQLLVEREQQVSLGYTYCGSEPCLKEFLNEYSTEKLDAQIRTVYRHLMKVAPFEKISNEAQKKVRDLYSQTSLDYTQDLESQCGESSQSRCTLSRVIWDEGGSNRIQHFSSNPADPITKRWGY